MKPVTCCRLLSVLIAVGPALASANGTDAMSPAPVIEPASLPLFAPVPAAVVWPALPMAPVMPPPAMAFHPAMGWVMLVPVSAGFPHLARGWQPILPIWSMAQPSLPAAVDYGPVADTPVVVLPETMPESDAGEEISRVTPVAAPEGMAGHPEPVDYGPVAVTPVIFLETPEAAADSGMERERPIQVETRRPVDYGPVARTPVVRLSAPRAARPAAPIRRTTARDKPASPTRAPSSPRLCWKNGVVAPCK